MGKSGKRGVTCYVIAYDISNDRRRTKVHKTLSGFGEWTQFSLFECHLTAKQFLILRDRLDQLLKPDEDSVRFYRLCRDCLEKTDTIGGEKPGEKAVLVL